MALQLQQVAAALDTIAERLSLAGTAFDWSHQDPYGEWNAEWHLQIAYTQLLTLAETQELPQLRADIARDLEAARTEGLLTTDCWPDGVPDLKWAGPPRRYVEALQGIFVNEPSRTVTKDIESILREATHSLSDPYLFGSPPPDESTVHRRLEGILRCVFPGLLHKPRLTKPIKHFEPDTGIPSIKTLIEYKYLSSPTQVASIADEVLADTRGYNSKDWTSFIYVIYETARIKPESEWRQLLRACDIDSSTTIVVLSGEGVRDRSGRSRPTKQRSSAAARSNGRRGSKRSPNTVGRADG